jgi:serine/threonine protein kinase
MKSQSGILRLAAGDLLNFNSPLAGSKNRKIYKVKDITPFRLGVFMGNGKDSGGLRYKGRRRTSEKKAEEELTLDNKVEEILIRCSRRNIHLTRNDFDDAFNQLSMVGYNVLDVIGSGGSSAIIKAIVNSPEGVKSKWYEEVEEMSQKSFNSGAFAVNLIEYALAQEGMYLDTKRMRIVNEPHLGKKFSSVEEVGYFLRKCSPNDIKLMLDQLSTRFPRKGQIVAIKLDLRANDRRSPRENRIAPLSLVNAPGSSNLVPHYDYGTIQSSDGLQTRNYHVMEYMMYSISMRELFPSRHLLDEFCVDCDIEPYYIENPELYENTVDQKLDILMEVMNGIGFLHTRGNIIHRDIKPENILITVAPNEDYDRFIAVSRQLEKTDNEIVRTGNLPRLVRQRRELETEKEKLSVKLKRHSVNLTDFGLVKRISTSGDQESRSNVTEKGEVLGSTWYMAPESICYASEPFPSEEGKHDRPSTDVYSLGCILYEILTGYPVYYYDGYRDWLKYYNAILKVTRPREPLQLNPLADRNLIKICARAMHREMDRRYQSIDEMKADMQKWCEYKSKSRLGRLFSPRVVQKDVTGEVFKQYDI